MLGRTRFGVRAARWMVGCLLATLAARAWGYQFDPVVVDPPGPGLVASLAAEFNTDGDFEGWTTLQTSGAAVSGGVLSATANPSNPLVQRLSIPSGPDLDLGFNDYLELRIQLPASYTGEIRIYYGTANNGTVGTNSGTPGTPGIDAGRYIVIPASKIPKDGAFHTYRYDLGLERLWRAVLSDLRVAPMPDASGNGLPFAIDFIRVGDLPNDVYLPNTSDRNGSRVLGPTAYELSSKHFRFSWYDYANYDYNDPAGQPVAGMDATRARGALRNAEEVWQVYVKLLGYREPAESRNPANRDGNKYKVNFLCAYSGYWMGGSANGFGFLNIEPSGLRVNPPSAVIPHETMHVFQNHQGGTMPGEFWENHANYGRERYYYFFDNLFPNTSGIDAEYINSQNLMLAHGRDYYLTWPIFVYLDENPDNLPALANHWPTLVAKIWQNNPSSTTPPLVTLDGLTPGTPVQDLLGYFARRMVTFDFSRKAAMTSALNNQNPTVWRRQHMTELVRVPDKPGWWRVPNEIAPMQGGYAIHRLVPQGSGAGRVVTVDFRGLPHAARQTGWRATLVIVNDSGQERYTPLWSGGANSVTLAANENQLYLVVAAAPDSIPYGGHSDLTWPYRTDPSKQRMHYEVSISGAVPYETPAGSTSGLVQHPNGGGWRSSNAQVDPSAYIGPNARVLGASIVGPNARIEDYAVIQGGSSTGNSPDILDNAIVSGHALVLNNSTVSGSAKVRDWAIVSGNGTTVSGNAIVAQHARVQAGTIGGDAIVKGVAIVQSGANVSGDAVLDGDYMAGRTHTTGFAFGHQPFTGVPDEWIRPAPNRITASYSFDVSRDTVTLDDYGSLEAFVRGTPTWIAADARRSGFYLLNGVDQWIMMERLVADARAWTFTAWVKPLGGVPNQALLWIGTGPTRRLALTPDDGTGRVRFTITDGALTQSIAGTDALPINLWSHVAVTIGSGLGTLYVNGTAVATGAVSIAPDRVLGPNTGADATHCYIGRSDGEMPPLRGAVDDVQFYRRALTGSEIAAMIPPPPSSPPPLQSAGTVYVDLRAGHASAGTDTWINLGTLGNFTRVGTPSLVANVASTGIPGVQFNGSNQGYEGPLTVADLHGSSDRSIEVWTYNPSLASEETLVSWGRRGATRQTISLNFGSNATWGAATHWADDVAWGTNPTANAWHHLVYTYDGSVVRVYSDGVLNNQKTLGGPLATVADQPINVGFQRESNNSRSLWYSGYINMVRVHGGVLTPAQIAANYAAGPLGRQPSAPPTLSAIADQSAAAGATVGPLAFTIGDPDTPLSALTVAAWASDPTLVPGANLVLGGSGASRSLTLTPAGSASGSTTITVSVHDGETRVTRSFTVTFGAANRARHWEDYAEPQDEPRE